MTNLGTRQFTYDPPAGVGLGEHHADPADPPLGSRALYPGAPPGWPGGDLTMADLDLAPGTVVTLRVHHPGDGHAAGPHDGTEYDEHGQVVVEWADNQGNGRATAVDPQVFQDFFREVQ